MDDIAHIQTGDILWLKTPQTLAHIDQAKTLSDKVRPFIALSPAEIKIDHNCLAVQDRPLFGVNCTSQDFLVEGRPHVKFTLTGQNKTTYALMDSVRNLGTQGQSMRCKDWLSDEDLAELQNGLDKIIRPEQRFFIKDLFNFKKSILPGQVHHIETVDAKGPALILLKRGKFVVNNDIECSEDFNKTSHETRFTPYLVLYFHNTKWQGTLRGIHPNNIRITSVHERDIHQKLGQIEDKNVENIINQIRRNSGLKPIRYQKMSLQHAFSVSPLLKMVMR